MDSQYTVTSPKHYSAVVEPIIFIMANNLDFLTGNVIKYVTRYKEHKDPVGSLRKAKQYLEWMIERQEALAQGLEYFGPLEKLSDMNADISECLMEHDLAEEKRTRGADQ